MQPLNRFFAFSDDACHKPAHSFRVSDFKSFTYTSSQEPHNAQRAKTSRFSLSVFSCKITLSLSDVLRKANFLPKIRTVLLCHITCHIKKQTGRFSFLNIFKKNNSSFVWYFKKGNFAEYLNTFLSGHIKKRSFITLCLFCSLYRLFEMLITTKKELLRLHSEVKLVKWCFEPSQLQRIISGLKTNFILSPSFIQFTSH